MDDGAEEVAAGRPGGRGGLEGLEDGRHAAAGGEQPAEDGLAQHAQRAVDSGRIVAVRWQQELQALEKRVLIVLEWGDKRGEEEVDRGGRCVVFGCCVGDMGSRHTSRWGLRLRRRRRMTASWVMTGAGVWRGPPAGPADVIDCGVC